MNTSESKCQQFAYLYIYIQPCLRMEIWKDNLFHFSICACQPCAGAMLIFFVSFHVNGSTPKGIHVCSVCIYIDEKYIDKNTALQ